MVIVDNSTKTYTTNIYILLMDYFMLSNTFGEYSHYKITRVMIYILLTKDRKKLLKKCTGSSLKRIN